mgnify:CR=1 FL=1
MPGFIPGNLTTNGAENFVVYINQRVEQDSNADSDQRLRDYMDVIAYLK